MKNLVFLVLLLPLWGCQEPAEEVVSPPNILIAISDDQSFPHASAYGFEGIQTPAFDRIAREGILFTQAFAASPGCSPSRAALLTGRNCWQIEAAGTHASAFPQKYVAFPDLLAAAGYHTGFTGKGWGPGNYQISGRTQNPAGPAWQEKKLEAPEGIADIDYAENFRDFLAAKKEGQPFYFWYGAREPHRVYKQGIGEENGMDPANIKVPGFLPDSPEMRSDMLDYGYEIQWFDDHLGKIIRMLEEAGELENTLIIVTADNGMPFPRAKANLYEYGFHVPMAIRWGKKVKGGRKVDDLVGFTDLAPTILEAAGVSHPGEYPMTGKSLINILKSDKSGITDPSRTAVYSSRERHSSSRFRSLSYPQRCIRTQEYLYVRNFKPERWPAGPAQKFGEGNYPPREVVERQEAGPMHGAYHDIDGCPALDFLIGKSDDPELGKYLDLAVARRPAEELFDIVNDPDCLNNLAEKAEFADIKQELSARLESYLTETGDPRITGNGDIWETYPRYSKLREYPTPDWARDDPGAIPEMPWLQEHWNEQE